MKTVHSNHSIIRDLQPQKSTDLQFIYVFRVSTSLSEEHSEYIRNSSDSLTLFVTKTGKVNVRNCTYTA